MGKLSRGWVVSEIIGIGIVNPRAVTRATRTEKSSGLMADWDNIQVKPIPREWDDDDSAFADDFEWGNDG